MNIKNNSSSSDSDRPILCFALQFDFFCSEFHQGFIKISEISTLWVTAIKSA